MKFSFYLIVLMLSSMATLSAQEILPGVPETPRRPGGQTMDTRAPQKLNEIATQLPEIIAIVGDTPILRSEFIEYVGTYMKYNTAFSVGLSEIKTMDEIKKRLVDPYIDFRLQLQLAEQQNFHPDSITVGQIFDKRIAEMNATQRLQLDNILKTRKTSIPEIRASILSNKVQSENVVIQAWVEAKILPTISLTDSDIQTTRLPPNATHKIMSIASDSARLAAKQEADSVRNAISKGADFAKMAKTYSVCASRRFGGDLGEVSKGAMIPEFDSVAFALELGKISETTETVFGYHIIKYLEKGQFDGSRILAHILIRPQFKTLNDLSSEGIQVYKKQKLSDAISQHLDAIKKTLKIVYKI